MQYSKQNAPPHPCVYCESHLGGTHLLTNETITEYNNFPSPLIKNALYPTARKSFDLVLCESRVGAGRGHPGQPPPMSEPIQHLAEHNIERGELTPLMNVLNASSSAFIS